MIGPDRNRQNHNRLRESRSTATRSNSWLILVFYSRCQRDAGQIRAKEIATLILGNKSNLRGRDYLCIEYLKYKSTKIQRKIPIL